LTLLEAADVATLAC